MGSQRGCFEVKHHRILNMSRTTPTHQHSHVSSVNLNIPHMMSLHHSFKDKNTLSQNNVIYQICTIARSLNAASERQVQKHARANIDKEIVNNHE